MGETRSVQYVRHGRLGQAEIEDVDPAVAGHKALDIAGDTLTAPEMAAIISRVADRTVTRFQVPIEEVRKGSADFALMLEWFDRVGYDADIVGNARTWGIAPTKFADWAAQQTW